MKRPRKHLPSKANFRTFLTLNCSYFRLSSVKILRVNKNIKEIKLRGVCGRLKPKKGFPETMTHKVLETNSSFHVKKRTTERVEFLFFKSFLLVLTKLSL